MEKYSSLVEENNNYHLHIKSYTLKVLIEISFYYSDNEKPCTDYNIMWPPFFNTRKCIYMFFLFRELSSYSAAYTEKIIIKTTKSYNFF